MKAELKIDPLTMPKSNTVFLKIDIVFKDSHGDLKIDNPVKIDISAASYTLAIDQSTRQLQILAVFTCNTYPKTIAAFSELSTNAIICIETETNPKLKKFFDDNFFSGVSEIERLFKLLRWKYTLGTSELKHLSENIFWSFDKKTWNSVERCPSVENVRVRTLNERALDTGMIEELMENGKSEPIFLELLREANSISHNNLRSACVIAVSALEVAVKYLIKNHVPITEWLVNEIPSPPIEKIIQGFFPKIIQGFKLTEDQIETLKSTISIRNKLVHSGQVVNERETLFKMMNFINDFIMQTINPNLK